MKFLPHPMRDWFGVYEDEDTKTLKMNATWAYMAEQMATPYVTNAGEIIPIDQPGFRGDKAKADTVSWMTGVRLTPVDVPRLERSWAFGMIDYLEARKQEADDRHLRQPAEERRLLRQFRQIAASLNRVEQRRQKELYGG